LDNLAKSFPQLVQSVLPKIISLPMMTEILRTLLSDGVPISDMRRILEGLGGSAGRGKSPADMAEALRPALAPLLIQKVTALGQTMPVITLAPELEQLMLRTLRQAGDDGLMLDNKLAETLIRTINETSEQLAAQGRPAICVVAPQIRRAFSNFVKPHVPQLIILGFTELPENRHVEVVASIGSTEGLVSPTPQKV
jgi:flagellar biosynthesis protein FlhA